MLTAPAAGRRPALVSAERAMTWAELEAAVEETAVALAGAGIGPGAVVGLLGENSAAWVAAYLALPRLGATALLLNMRLADAELRGQLAATGARAVLADSGMAGRDLGGIRIMGFPSGSQGAPSRAARAGDDLPRSRRARALVFTSGSSGRPKCAILTGPQLRASAGASAARFGLTGSDVWLAALPFFHVGGLAIVHRMALCGGTIALVPRFEVESVRDAIRRFHVTRLSLTPTMLAGLAAGGWRVPAHVRTVLLGGERIPADLLEACPQAVASYGMTETGSHVAVGERGQLALAPLPGFEIRILGRDGSPRPAGEEGRIAVRGPAVMRGYLGGPPLAGGWFHTGDAGVLEAAGRLLVVSRPGELIQSGGENVSLAEVEDVLRGHPDVAAVAVAGVPHARWGEVPAALVVPRPGAAPPGDLEAFARRYLAGFKVPGRFAFAAELPVLSTGKIDRAAVASLLAGSAPAAASRRTRSLTGAE